MFDPDAMAMCCLPSNWYVIGEARHTLFIPNCQSGFPVDASTAANLSWSSQKNTRPLAVASVPPRAPPGPVCGSSQAIFPVFTSIARRIF